MCLRAPRVHHVTPCPPLPSSPTYIHSPLSPSFATDQLQHTTAARFRSLLPCASDCCNGCLDSGPLPHGHDGCDGNDGTHCLFLASLGSCAGPESAVSSGCSRSNAPATALPNAARQLVRPCLCASGFTKQQICRDCVNADLQRPHADARSQPRLCPAALPLRPRSLPALGVHAGCPIVAQAPGLHAPPSGRHRAAGARSLSRQLQMVCRRRLGSTKGAPQRQRGPPQGVLQQMRGRRGGCWCSTSAAGTAVWVCCASSCTSTSSSSRCCQQRGFSASLPSPTPRPDLT